MALIRSAGLAAEPLQLARRRTVVEPAAAPAASAVDSPVAAPAPAAPEIPAGLIEASVMEERIREIEAGALAWKEEIEANLQHEYAEAHRKGYEAGLEEGAAAGRELLAEQAGRLSSVAAQLGRVRQDQVDAAEDDMVAIAFAAICRMLGDAHATADGVRQLVRQAIGSANEGGSLVIHLHPDDLDLLKADTPDSTLVDMVADDSVALGGCRIVSNKGTLDARVETQLELLAQTLLKVRAERAQSGEQV